MAADHADVSFGFWFRLPSAYLSANASAEPDLIRIRTPSGTNEFYIKLRAIGGQASIVLFTVEQDESAAINLQPDTWYWFTGLFGSTHRLRAYDANGSQVGVERTRSGASQQTDFVQFGSLIGNPDVWGPFDFDDLILDWTDATFPLGPPQ
jgi:hypothetical protein